MSLYKDLIDAVTSDNVNHLKKLIENINNPNLSTLEFSVTNGRITQHGTLLHIAAFFGDENSLVGRYLMEHCGFDCNRKSSVSKKTPWMIACENFKKKARLVLQMLEFGGHFSSGNYYFEKECNKDDEWLGTLIPTEQIFADASSIRINDYFSKILQKMDNMDLKEEHVDSIFKTAIRHGVDLNDYVIIDHYKSITDIDFTQPVSINRPIFMYMQQSDLKMFNACLRNGVDLKLRNIMNMELFEMFCNLISRYQCQTFHKEFIDRMLELNYSFENIDEDGNNFLHYLYENNKDVMYTQTMQVVQYCLKMETILGINLKKMSMSENKHGQFPRDLLLDIETYDFNYDFDFEFVLLNKSAITV